VYAASGNRAEAKKILQQLDQLSKQRYLSGYNMAIVCAGLGDSDGTFAWLDKAYQEHSFDISKLKQDPEFASVHQDPRFLDLLRRVHLPQ
jgi:hypothetical protein